MAETAANPFQEPPLSPAEFLRELDRIVARALARRHHAEAERAKTLDPERTEDEQNAPVAVR